MTRILLIAEAANPEWVSVPLVGWSIAIALKQVANVHIVTQVRNRDAFLRAGLVEGKDFTAIDSEAVARPLHRFSEKIRGGKGKGWTTAQAISAISYTWFERLVWQRFGASIRKGEWDIVHRVTPLSPAVSSSIAPKCKRAGVPFVMGPINGGVPWPKEFGAARRAEREWLSYFRELYKFLPRRARTLRAASAIIVGSRIAQSEIPTAYKDRCVYIPENAIDPERFHKAAIPGVRPGPIRIAFVGRLVPLKGCDMLVEALAPLMRAGEVRLDIVGDGPEAGTIDTLVEKEGVGDAVIRHGWREHRHVQDILVKCDLLGLPSIREFGGGVVLEAMALGLPALVLDYAGPGELVQPGTGYKVPLGTRSEIVGALRATVETISSDRTDLVKTGMRARERVSCHFTWERKAEQITQVHDWVLGHRKNRPAPFDFLGAERADKT